VTTRRRGKKPRAGRRAKGTAVTAPKRMWVPRRSVCRTHRSSPEMPARAARKARCTRASNRAALCERALKKAILHRKNAYFYKTENGARVGDLFMSVIHTCELNGVNPFEYLTELHKHANELSTRPADWMSWNYPDTLQTQTVDRRSS